jgi:hypothetical protein
MLLARKLRQPSAGQPKPPLTKLKELPAEQRAKVMDLLRSQTYEEAQPGIEQLVGFSCPIYTLTRFHHWQKASEAMEVSAETTEQIGDFLRERYPDWTEEKMRETASAFFTMLAMSRQDTRGFACVARLGLESGRDRILAEKLKFDKAKTERKLALNEQRLELDTLKLRESLRKKVDVGLDALAKAFKKYPEAMELYQQAREKLREVSGQ